MSGRKLQGDIERTIKKVGEGIDVFDEIWEKVYSATNQTQKEKYEADLKKEIKKLQRLRDQIKNWLSSNDIKDKKILIEKRKDIEKKMEMFKVCEKETKTKAYSKEGLLQPQKRDPEEVAREEAREWITECLEKLKEQVDKFEADLENLQNKGKKGKDKDFKDKIDHLDQSIQQHKLHIRKLELVLRLLDNGKIPVDGVNDLHDSVDYYLESNQDPDFVADEGIYDSLIGDFVNDDWSDEIDDEDDDTIGDDEEDGSESSATPPSASMPAPTSSSAPIQIPSSKHSQSSLPLTSPQKLIIPKSPPTKPMPSPTVNPIKGKPASQPVLPPTPNKATSAQIATATTTATSAAATPTPAPVAPTPTTTTATAAATIVPTTPKKQTTSQPPPPPPSSQSLAQPTQQQQARDDASGSKSAKQQPHAVPKPPQLQIQQHTTPPLQPMPAPSSVPQQPQPQPQPQQPKSQQGQPQQPSPTPPRKASEPSPFTSPVKQQGAGKKKLNFPDQPPQPASYAVVAQQGLPEKQSSSQPLTPVSQPPTAASFPQAPVQQPPQMLPPTQPQAVVALPPQPTSQPSVPQSVQQSVQQQQPHQLSQRSPQIQAQPSPTPFNLSGSKPPTATPSPAPPTAPSPPVAVQQQQQQQQTAMSQQPVSAAPSISPGDEMLFNLIKNSPANEMFGADKQATAAQQQQQQPGIPSAMKTGAANGFRLVTEEESSADLLNDETFGNSTGLDGMNSMQDLALHTQELRTNEAHHLNLQMLEASLSSIPLPTDSERPRQYIPLNPHRTADSFPLTPAPIFNDPVIFEKFDTDTLFFIFYYQQGTYQQYLAARELKKQSWRYHKKYLTWFQRHYQPKIANDEFEQGTYVYFDYETGWCQRIKSEFRFEYQFLEDELPTF